MAAEVAPPCHPDPLFLRGKRLVWREQEMGWVIPNIEMSSFNQISNGMSSSLFLFDWKDKDERNENYYLIIF
jgi:hypothetical protein